jgi:hypothetical protein
MTRAVSVVLDAYPRQHVGMHGVTRMKSTDHTVHMQCWTLAATRS